MNVRDLLDGVRESWVSNPNIAPTRTITYTHSIDNTPLPIDCFVSGAEFNSDLADDKVVNTLSCSAVKLTIEPTIKDKITYNGKDYRVSRWDKMGNLYRVIAENGKRNKTTSRRFT